MIRKSLFEQELIAGMQQELCKQASSEPSLVQAGECLHAAMEILEEAGLQASADQILSILHKIAAVPTKHVQKMPSVKELQEHGLTTQDIKDFGAGVEGAKIKMNAVLRNMGMTEPQIVAFIGKHNLVPEKEVNRYLHIMKMIETPTVPLPAEAVPEKIKFKSLAARPRKPRRPDTIRDTHTKNLTPEKMINNLKDHGTVFNMADDGLDISNADFDPELAEALDAHNADDLEVDDILNVDIHQPHTFDEDWEIWKNMRKEDDFPEEIPPPPDTVRAIPTPKPHPLEEEPFDMDIDLEDITDADDDTLYVTDQEPLEDFEDEVSSPK